jgi:hypothetical protein
MFLAFAWAMLHLYTLFLLFIMVLFQIRDISEFALVSYIQRTDVPNLEMGVLFWKRVIIDFSSSFSSSAQRRITLVGLEERKQMQQVLLPLLTILSLVLFSFVRLNIKPLFQSRTMLFIPILLLSMDLFGLLGMLYSLSAPFLSPLEADHHETSLFVSIGGLFRSWSHVSYLILLVFCGIRASFNAFFCYS